MCTVTARQAVSASIASSRCLRSAAFDEDDPGVLVTVTTAGFLAESGDDESADDGGDVSGD
jgi:hypothetical protein